MINEKSSDLISTIDHQLWRRRVRTSSGRDGPVILLIEELDKVREILPDGTEETRALIGILNQILDDGKISTGNLSDVMVVTTMNLPLRWWRIFQIKSYKRRKAFINLPLKILKNFISGSVEKKGPWLIFSLRCLSQYGWAYCTQWDTDEAFSESDYEKIIRIVIDSTIESLTTGDMPIGSFKFPIRMS